VNVALEEFDKDRIDLGFVDTLARLLATLRERTLREAADNLRALAPNGAGYGRKEWDDFNFNLPCADAIDVALKIGEDAILSLIAQPPKPERSDGSEAEGREEAT
jgi:hypothetical protein